MAPKIRLPFYNPIDPTCPKIWPDYTLVMPVCAVGNIGQLACDLVISTLLSKRECQLVGRLYSPCLMSVVGPNAFSLKGPPTSSTEVYESKKHKLVIMQQRTSYFKNLKHLYIEELVHWIKESKFDRVLVLTSSFAQCNPDTSQLGQLTSCSVSTITTNLFEKDESWSSLGLKQIPDRRTSKVVQDGLTYLPGSGITKPLIKACEKANIPTAFLVDFCSEGINIQDCYEVVNIVDRLLNLGCNSSGTSSAKTATEPEVSRPTLLDGDDFSLAMGHDGGDNLTNSRMGWVEPFSWAQAQC